LPRCGLHECHRCGRGTARGPPGRRAGEAAKAVVPGVGAAHRAGPCRAAGPAEGHFVGQEVEGRAAALTHPASAARSAVAANTRDFSFGGTPSWIRRATSSSWATITERYSPPPLEASALVKKAVTSSSAVTALSSKPLPAQPPSVRKEGRASARSAVLPPPYPIGDVASMRHRHQRVYSDAVFCLDREDLSLAKGDLLA